MRHRSLAFGLSFVTVLACESEGPDGPARPPEERNGQTGSPGGVECYEAAECRAWVDALVDALRSPAQSSRTFVTSECTQVTFAETGVSGPTCACNTGGGDVLVGPQGAGCAAIGRGGDCLYDAEEFPGCTLGEAGACQEVCDELEQRFAADAARTFDARVVHAACANTGCETVIEVEGRCFPQNALSLGRGYDCALGARAILDAYAKDTAPPEEPPEVSFGLPSPYRKGTQGFVTLGVARDAWGAYADAVQFYASAQFFTVERESRVLGEEIDPLEGVDDCGVLRSRNSTGPDIQFFPVDEAELVRGDMRVPVVPTIAHNEYFSSYAADLTGEVPAYGATYSFRAAGGGLKGEIEVPVRLPEALEITSLAGVSRVDKGALALSWTGTGTEPLHLLLWVEAKLSDSPTFYEIQCLLEDDGAFEIPASVLEAAPEGIVTAMFTRALRSVEKSGAQALLTVGEVRATHHFALGAEVQNQAARDACLAYYAHEQAERSACQAVQPLPEQAVCPDYLSQTQAACVEYFECNRKNLACTPDGLVSRVGCSCG